MIFMTNNPYAHGDDRVSESGYGYTPEQIERELAEAEQNAAEDEGAAMVAEEQ